MITPEHNPVRPPPAPAFAPRIRFDLPELIGLPLLAALPVLAIGGLFDEQRALTAVGDDGLVLKIDYPSRLRFQENSVLDLVIRNERPQRVDGVRLAIDRRYLAHFDSLRFEPPSGSLRSDHWELALNPLAPHEVRHVRIEVRPAEPGFHRGRFSLRTADGTAVSTGIHTLIWP